MGIECTYRAVNTDIDDSTARAGRWGKASDTFDQGCEIKCIYSSLDCKWVRAAVYNTAREDRSTILLNKRQDNGSLYSSIVVVKADFASRIVLTFY